MAAGGGVKDSGVEDNYYLHRRFDRLGRLVGDPAIEKLLGANVAIIGLGGVGSFAAEAILRSAVGNITLVEFDKICVTNSNRQVQAQADTVGHSKVAVLAKRLAAINPQARVQALEIFYNSDTAEDILGAKPDYVVDAIDNITAKCSLLADCKKRGIPVVTSCGASARIDPTRVEVADLAATCADPLAIDVRKILRKKYGFPAKGDFGIQAVFSQEPVRKPIELHYDHGAGFRCVCPGGHNAFHSCDKRALVYGTAGFVTGAFGLACASVVVRGIIGD